MRLVLVENDVSAWQDETGVKYHFPKKYARLIQPGAKFVYYKGRLKDKSFSKERLSDDPHYFGSGVIGKIFPDRKSDKGDLFATIDSYKVFSAPVGFKDAGNYIEAPDILKPTNHWRDAVRPISAKTFNRIVSGVTSTSVKRVLEIENRFNDTEQGLESYEEGAAKKRYVTYYERDKRNRTLAIAIHGDSCLACGFNFGETYGKFGEGYIHVHHVTPVSELTATSIPDPETDLVPLCANCHSIVHRKKDTTLSIEELKLLMQSSS